MTPAVTFEEKQVNPPWMGWLAGCIGVGALAFLFFRIGELWLEAEGELTEDLKDLLGGAVGMSIGFTVLVWMVFSIQLMVIVDREGLTYFCFPLYFSEKRIEAEDIASFRIRKITFAEFLQSGGRRRLFLRGPQKKVICVIRCWTVADLRLKDGRNVILGTTNPDGIERALNKLLTHTI
jgi:hypothetical protein